MNIEETMIAIDGRTGPIAAMTRTVGNMGASARRGICLLDARLRTLSAEYAVVLVAATGFAAVLVALLKSDTIKTLLTNIVKKSLSVG
mgnify:CR=1 FL=1